MLRISALVLSFCLAACGASGASAPQAPIAAREDAARALFERGLVLIAEGDSVRAEQYLAASLREGHDWRQALPPLLRVCLTGSRLRAGLNYASPYLRAHPDELWLRYLVATVYLGLGQPLRAREQLHAIRGKAPYQGRTEYLLGQTEWEGFGNAAAAAEHFREYLRVEPNGASAREVSEWLSQQGLAAPGTAAAPAAALAGAGSEGGRVEGSGVEGGGVAPAATPGGDDGGWHQPAPAPSPPPAAVAPSAPEAAP